MRAAVLYEARQPLQIDDVTVEGPRSGEVLVRVAATGVCHSDYHVISGDWHGRAFPLPMVVGHEAAGEIAEVGPGVDHLRVGDHVVLSFLARCGHCERCVAGQPHLCERRAKPGTMWDGTRRLRRGDLLLSHFGCVSGFAEFSVVHSSQAIPVRSDLSFEVAALMGCAVLTGVGAVLNTARVEPGATMAVFGTGGVGLSVIQGGVLASASRIIAIDLFETRLEYARQLGATETVNAARRDPVAAIEELSGGKGVDYAFDAIGIPAVGRQAYDAARRGGTVVLVGMAPTGSDLSVPASITWQEKTIRGCYYGSSRPAIDIPRLVSFYTRGQLRLDEMISHRYSLEEINEAFVALAQGEGARSVIVMRD